MTETSVKAGVPAWYWVVAILALLWNLLGVLGFAGTLMVMNNAQMEAALPAEAREIYANAPLWTVVAYAVAVFAGVAGAIALLIRKGWAGALFAVSLIAIVVNDIYYYGIAQLQSVSGRGALIMPAIVLIVAMFLIWFARTARRKGYMR